MEENGPKPKQKRSIYFFEFLISFTIFDIIHLVCASVLIGFAYHSNPIDIVDAGGCFVEITFALLLMSFIGAFTHHHKYVDRPHVTFTMGCLTACASLIIPLGIELPEIIRGEWAGPFVEIFTLLAVSFGLTFTAFALLFVSLLLSERKKAWIALVTIALFLMVCLAPIEFVLEMNSGYPLVEVIFRCIKALAPLSFAPIGILLIVRPKSRNSFFRDLV